METRIKLGVSKCLLGENVRYDGKHKLDRVIRNTLGQYLDFVPVCPEVECGMSIPREAMQLAGDPEFPRLMTIRTQKDLTDQMLNWTGIRLCQLEKEGLYGYIFKRNSPSCGMKGVNVYNEKGMPAKKGAGLFARAFMKRFPLLPTEGEDLLHDPGLRENFMAKIRKQAMTHKLVMMNGQQQG